MPWIFQQSSGYFMHPDGVTLLTIGYAGGNMGKNPEGKNNPAMQNIVDVGPIPRGFYTFGEPVDHSTKGPFAIPLIPDPENEMFGRAGFFWHGDTIANPGCASEGCPVSRLFARQAAWESNDHRLQVIQ